MVGDNEVKTVVSPFAVRENEVKVFDGKDGFASINQVVFKMDMGYINESHIKALEVVNEFSYVTSRQVTQILDFRGKLSDIEPDKKQTKVAKWLEDLTKSKVISRYYFQSEAGKSSYRVYAMDKIATVWFCNCQSGKTRTGIWEKYAEIRHKICQRNICRRQTCRTGK